MLDYQKSTLTNGLSLILVPMKNLASVSMVLGVGAGGRDDPSAKAGLSHFLEHMASKGTKKRPTPFEVAKVIDSVGGEQNASTSKEFTQYWIKLSSAHLEQAFDVLADNLKNSLFAPKQIEKEKGVIIEEINMYRDTPTHRIMDVFESVLYGRTPLGWELAGDKKTVARIRKGDFLNYLKQFYQPGNMVLVIAGGFDVTRAKELARKHFGNLRKGKRSERKKLSFRQKKPRLKLIYKKTDQAHFCLGVHGVNYSHPDRFAISVMASVLGYSRTSRLYRRVREEKGWAYYIFASPEFYTDIGALFFNSSVKLDKIEEVIQIVKEESFGLAQRLVPASELKRAKEYLKGRLILALEDSSSVASRYALQEVVEGKLRKPEETIRLIDKVTAKDIRRVAKRLFKPQKLNLALIGPYKSESRFKKLLS